MTQMVKFDTDEVFYPDNDGKPMADNSKQAEWIVLLFENLRAIFAVDPNVFVAADNLWYPVKGQNKICSAPDVYVVFGRPKGYRGSYRQWLEGGIPLTVAIEIVSPSNTVKEMAEKQKFYDGYGVEEYYVYNPDTNHLQAYHRQANKLAELRTAHGCRSPRMGITFDLSGPELVVCYPDGRPFQTLLQEQQRTETERKRAETERKRAETERKRAETERKRAETERKRAEQAEQRMAHMIALTGKLLRGEASTQDLAELRGLQEGTTVTRSEGQS